MGKTWERHKSVLSASAFEFLKRNVGYIRTSPQCKEPSHSLLLLPVFSLISMVVCFFFSFSFGSRWMVCFSPSERKKEEIEKQLKIQTATTNDVFSGLQGRNSPSRCFNNWQGITLADCSLQTLVLQQPTLDDLPDQAPAYILQTRPYLWCRSP